MGGTLHHDIVPGGNERQGVVIMSDEFERTGKPVSHLNQRLTTEAKSKLREVDFGVLVKQLEDLRTTLVGKLEIVARRVEALSRRLLKFSGGSVDILRDVLH